MDATRVKLEDETKAVMQQPQDTNETSLGRHGSGVTFDGLTHRQHNTGARRRASLEEVAPKSRTGLKTAEAVQTKAIPATICPDFVDSSHSETSSELQARQESQRALAQLMIQARNLKRNHQLVSRQLYEAQERIDQNALQRGQMIQQYLQLDRDIKQKERDIAADEIRLRSLRLSQGRFADDITELLEQIQLIG